MPLSLQQKEAIFKAVRTVLKKQSEVQSEDTTMNKVLPFATEMLLTAGDLVVDTVNGAGSLSISKVGVFVINRTAGFAGLSDGEKTQCFGALLGLATSGADFIEVASVAGTAEVASAGAATPAVSAVSIPMLISTGAALVLSAGSVNQQCGPLVSQFFRDRQDDLLQLYMQFNTFIGNPLP